MSGAEVKATPRAELMALAKVKDAFKQAEAQLVAYRSALSRRHGNVLKLRAYAVVAVGFERLLVRYSPAMDQRPVPAGQSATDLPARARF